MPTTTARRSAINEVLFLPYIYGNNTHTYSKVVYVYVHYNKSCPYNFKPLQSETIKPKLKNT